MINDSLVAVILINLSREQRLNEDVCNLSTLCSETKQLNASGKIDKSEILDALKTWQDTGHMPEDEIVSHVVKACSEVRLEYFPV